MTVLLYGKVIDIICDDDALGQARVLADSLHTSFRMVINEALLAGLEMVAKPAKYCEYKTVPHAMNVREGCDLDNIQELLTQVESDLF